MKTIIVSVFILISLNLFGQTSDADMKRFMDLNQEIVAIFSNGTELTPQQNDKLKANIRQMKSIVNKDPSLAALGPVLQQLLDAFNMDDEGNVKTDSSQGILSLAPSSSSTPSSSISKSNQCQCLFKYSKTGGDFVLYYQSGADKSIGACSSGYSVFANDGSFTVMSGAGAIPPGQYEIRPYSGSKFVGMPNVFDVWPVGGTNTYNRSQFKIHGPGVIRNEDKVVVGSKSAADSSNGCLILDVNQREELAKYFNACGGIIILTVITY